MRRRGVFVFCILLIGSCSRKEAVVHEAPAPVASAATITPEPLDTPDASDQSSASTSAWTDPKIVDKLRTDCAFDPNKLTEAQRDDLFGDRFAASQLSCAGSAFDQSCVYDPCFEGDEHDCRATCLKDCDTCADQCTGSCMACKANCTDDVCRDACAPKCASCKQSCLTTQDHCRTGKCAQVYGACRKRLAATWKARNCAAICATYGPCRDACFEKMSSSGSFDFNACNNQCKSPFKTTCDFGLCGGKSGMGIEMP